MSRGAKTKGYIKNTNTGRVFKFQYNPPSFSTSRESEFVEMKAPGLSYPKFQYVGGSAREFQLDLFLTGSKKAGNDYGQKGYPSWFVSQMLLFMPHEDSSKGNYQPTILIVAIGSFIKKCVVTKIEENYDEFHTDLAPKTINLKITLRVVA